MTFTRGTRTIGNTSGTSTLSHNNGANVKWMVVALWSIDGQRAGGDGLTYNSVAPDGKIGIVDDNNSANAWLEVFYWIAPSTGASYAVNFPNDNSDSIYFEVIGYENSVASSLDASNTGEGSSTNPSINVTVVDSSAMMYGAMIHGRQNTSGFSAGSAYTELIKLDVGNECILSEEDLLVPGTGSQTVDWTQATADDWGIIGISVREPAAAGQPVMKRTQGIPTGPGSRDRPGRWN